MKHRLAGIIIAPLLYLAVTAGRAPAAPVPPQGVLGGPIGGIPTPAPLPPVDEASKQPEFFAFRAHLLTALARRDVDAVLAVLSPDITLSFGGDHGIEGFLEKWRPRAADSKLWETLTEVLALGGTFSGDDHFLAPYVYSVWPHDLDGFDHVALLAADVPIRSAPRDDAPIIVRSSFGVLPLARPDGDVEGWTAVRIDGKTGYVPARSARGPVDYRAFFERRDGVWKMVIFVAGD